MVYTKCGSLHSTGFAAAFWCWQSCTCAGAGRHCSCTSASSSNSTSACSTDLMCSGFNCIQKFMIVTKLNHLLDKYETILKL